MNKRKKKVLKILLIVFIVLALLVGGCAVYLADYYRADEDAIGVFLQGESIPEENDGLITFEPKGAEKGFIFYPGGKVEYTSYIPLMQSLGEKGILCVLVKMPFNLAVLDKNAADGIQEKYPEIKDWYIGGHSLGGAMAASYLSDNAELYEGLVLLGAYCADDLSKTDLDVLSIYGSEDRVMDREKYEEYKKNLPDDFTETLIEGGCHAYFGMYGPQDGDGKPSITNEAQIDLTAEHIFAMMSRTE